NPLLGGLSAQSWSAEHEDGAVNGNGSLDLRNALPGQQVILLLQQAFELVLKLIVRQLTGLVAPKLAVEATSHARQDQLHQLSVHRGTRGWRSTPGAVLADCVVSLGPIL